MKESTIEKIEKEIDEKTTLSDETKNSIRKDIFINIIVGAVIISYFIFIILGSMRKCKNYRKRIVKPFQFYNFRNIYNFI